MDICGQNVGVLLRKYKVLYISGLKKFQKIISGLFLSICSEGIVIEGKNFPVLCIPYSSISEFKPTTGYGSVWRYAGSADSFHEKMIHIAYKDTNGGEVLLKLEMAVAVASPRANYRACRELFTFIRENGFDSKFSKEKNQQSDIFSQIEKLSDLYRAGILTETEFEAKKAELLRRI